MKHVNFGWMLILGLTILVSGCSKKSADQAGVPNSEFDSLIATEELAQLPQSSTTNQQNAIEVLPIETTPVTQGIPAPGLTGPAGAQALSTAAETLSSVSTESMTHQQKIQQALKNAGLYEGAIDGKIGPKSRKAIETFQQQQGLKVDGKVGPKTWAALERYLSGAQPTTGAPAATD